MGNVFWPAIPGIEIPEVDISGWFVPVLDDKFYGAYLWIFIDQVKTSVTMPDCSSDCKPISLLESKD